MNLSADMVLIYGGALLGGAKGLPGWTQGAPFAIDFGRSTAYVNGAPALLSTLFTCARTQTVPSYVTNADGTLTSCAANTLRVGVGTGILIEEARTNKILQSGDQSNAAWTTQTSGAGTVSVVGGSAGTGPDGVGSAAVVTINRTASTDDAQLLQTFTGTAAAYSGGFYIKANANSEIGKQLTVGLFDGTTYTSSLVILTGGWQRVLQAGATLAASASCKLFIGYRNGDTASTGSVAFQSCCAQAELGAGLSSYIPTAAAAVARNADNISCAGALLTLCQTATAMTQFARVVGVESTAPAGGRIGVTFNAGSGAAMCFINSSNAITAFNHTTVATPTPVGGLTQFVGYPVNTVASFSASGLSFVANGGTEATQALVMPTVATAFLGSAGIASSYMNGYLQRLLLWNTQLGSTQRIALSQTYNTTSAVVGGQNTDYYVPTEQSSGVLVMYHHGAGETVGAWTTDALKRSTREALLAQGHVLSDSDAAFENWGNQAGLDTYTAQYADAITRYPISKVVFFSQSMGGFTGLLTIANASFPVKGWYGIYPGCSLSWCFNNNASFTPEITTAYNISGGNYAAQTAGHDPILKSGSLFTIPMRFTGSAADTTMNKAANATAMQALVAATAAESFLLNTVGNHGDASNFIPSDMVNFFARC